MTVNNARKFKTIDYTLTIQSDALSTYLDKQLSSVIGSLGRIAQLLAITKSDKDMHSKLRELVSNVELKTNKEIEEFDVKFELLTSGMPLHCDTVTATGKAYPIQIGHPILWVGVNTLKAIEERANNIELYWYNGIIQDDERESAERELNLTIRRFVSSIYDITNIKGRDGGKFSAGDFLKSLRALESGEMIEVAEVAVVANIKETESVAA